MVPFAGVAFAGAGQQNPARGKEPYFVRATEARRMRRLRMTLSTPDAIRTLQRKLYRKAKQEPSFRFYALYDKVYRADILGHAYDLARRNKGAPGVDGVTFDSIETGEGVEVFLARLREELAAKTYRAGPVRRVYIEKPDGGERPPRPGGVHPQHKGPGGAGGGEDRDRADLRGGFL